MKGKTLRTATFSILTMTYLHTFISGSISSKNGSMLFSYVLKATAKMAISGKKKSDFNNQKDTMNKAELTMSVTIHYELFKLSKKSKNLP